MHLENALLLSQRLEEVVHDKFLVLRVHLPATNAEQPKKLEILLFDEFLVVVCTCEARGQIFNYLLRDKIVNKEVVVLQQLLKQVELAIDVGCNYIIKDEFEPLGDMHFEQVVFAD